MQAQRIARPGNEARRAKPDETALVGTQEATHEDTGKQNGARRTGSDDLSTHNSPDPT
ncbi:Hypothetical predicted protein, partial [Pelobates cultripes]